jgi:hypothetical protein
MLVGVTIQKEGWKMPKVEIVKLDETELEIVGGGAPVGGGVPGVSLVETVLVDLVPVVRNPEYTDAVKQVGLKLGQLGLGG